MMNEAVHSIMSSQLITVQPDTTLSKVRKIFMDHKIHHLPVLEDDKLVGILTTYDMWKNELPPSAYQSTIASQVMNRNIAVIGPNDKVGTAAEIFLDNRFHALPVVDSEQKLVGIVTTFDVLLYEFKKEYPKPILFKHLYNDTQDQQRSMSA